MSIDRMGLEYSSMNYEVALMQKELEGLFYWALITTAAV